MFDVKTVGGSPAAILLGQHLRDTTHKAFKRSVLRNLNTVYTNVAAISASLPKPQRETALWAYFRDIMTKADYYLQPKFNGAEVSYSLYESVVKTAVRKALRLQDEIDAEIEEFYEAHPLIQGHG